MLSKNEAAILKSIPKARSDNDPHNPEFPADAPKFPATPTYRIKLPGYKNLWLKDESYNPTGTHKDRMAWEMVCQYRHFLEVKNLGLASGPLPQFSMISSGNAAYAVSTALQKYHLPKLKILVDITTKPHIVEILKQNHCEVYFTDLSIKKLDFKDILRLTHNPNGFDVTSNDALDRTTIFYDWLSFEIINNDADYIVCPFGTGELYENICNILKRESQKVKAYDPRLQIKPDHLGSIHVIGATSSRADTIADKLYAPHLPFTHFNEQWLGFYRNLGYIGKKSGVFVVQERYIKKAYDYMTETLGVRCEPSGAAGLAYLLQNNHRIPKHKKIVVVNTGKGLY